MAKCSYVGPSGVACAEEAGDGAAVCFWHDRTVDKRKQDVKALLEERVRQRITCEGFELSGANLADAYLMEGDFSHANLQRVNLREGHLFGIRLKAADLFRCDLRDANLKEAVLAGADLLKANLDGADLERVDWGAECVLKNHRDALFLAVQKDPIGAAAKYLEAEEIYRRIRQRYEAAGTTDVAGQFFYHEMVCKRKQLPMWSIERLWSKMVDAICGYGENPLRVIGVSATCIVFCALVFSVFGMMHDGQVYTFAAAEGLRDDLNVLGLAIYLSVITFTTVGYGDVLTLGLGKVVAMAEAVAGIFLNSMFLLTFVKKMTRG
jgi:hypothetical protein